MKIRACLVMAIVVSTTLTSMTVYGKGGKGNSKGNSADWTSSNSSSGQAVNDETSTKVKVIKSDLEVQGALWIGDSLSLGTGEATGINAVAEGGESLAIGDYSHAEGFRTAAEGIGAHAEGLGGGVNEDNLGEIVASGNGSHAEGLALNGEANIASGDGAHAEGRNTVAQGAYSHAAGQNGQALDANTFVWSDGEAISSSAEKQFTVHAENGIRLLGGPITGDGSGLTGISVDSYDGSIHGDQIVDGTVSGVKIEGNAIGSSHIQNGTISYEDLDEGSVINRFVDKNGDTIQGDLDIVGNAEAITVTVQDALYVGAAVVTTVAGEVLTVQAAGGLQVLNGPIVGDGSGLTGITVESYDGSIHGDQIVAGTISYEDLDEASVTSHFVDKNGDTIQGDLEITGDAKAATVTVQDTLHVGAADVSTAAGEVLTVQAAGGLHVLNGPIVGDGSGLTNLPLQSVGIIDDDIILEVSTDPNAAYQTINQALESLRGRVIGMGSVTIQLADGTYEHPECVLDRADGNRIYIIGNRANPGACVLRFNGSGIRASEGSQIGFIAGLTLDGKNRDGSGYALQVCRAGRTRVDDCFIKNFSIAMNSMGASSLRANRVRISNCNRALLVSRNACLEFVDGVIAGCDLGLNAYYGGVGIIQNSTMISNQRDYSTSSGAAYIVDDGVLTTLQ